jgi:hypothetical protein
MTRALPDAALGVVLHAGRAASWAGNASGPALRRKETSTQGTVHTNAVESASFLFKPRVMGTCHRIRAEHLSASLQETSFRFNRRNNDETSLDVLRHMITCRTLAFEKLTAA